MMIGNLDGKGKVYTDDGEPVLRPGESIVRRVEGDNIDVSEGSSFWNLSTLFPSTPERGVLFLTSHRLLFLRSPNPDKVVRGYGYTTGTPDAIAGFYRAYRLYKAGALEYVEVEYPEVEGYLVKNARSGVLFLASRRDITRKAILRRKSRTDDKLQVLRQLLQSSLPLTMPEDRKGTFCLGDNRPFFNRKE